MKRIIIIGGGPGGIAAGYELQRAGFTDFVILEATNGVGGTWRNNTYPGCRCDVPSHLYSFSFAPKLDWSEPYAGQPEILAYMEDVVDRFGLRKYFRYNSKAESAIWSDADSSWSVRTHSGQIYSGDILIGAVGLFNEPAYPTIPGLKSFSGPIIHSARWDDSVSLYGKSVGMIGSAASAVQIAPEIAKTVEHLTIYQRTPNWVGPRPNEFSETFKTEARADAAAASKAERERIRGWLESVITLDQPETMELFKKACLENLNLVKDPEIRAKLLPDYPFGSKRGLVSSDWFQIFNQSNVELVTEPIERISEIGIVTNDGKERGADIIVLATGFQTMQYLSAVKISGRAGLVLNDVWAKGPRAYLGITVPGFPNMFMLYGPNTNNGSILEQIESQVAYILKKLVHMDTASLRAIEVNAEPFEDYNSKLQADIAKVAVWHAGVRDYYRTPEDLIVTQWPHNMTRYQIETERDDSNAYSETPSR